MNTPSYLSGAVFAKAHKALRATVVACLKQYNLSPTAWTFLGAVCHTPDGIRLVELAEHLSVKAPLITLMTHGFIERGLIQRIEHPHDARAKLLIITPEGKKLVSIVETEINHSLEHLLQGISTTELDAYKKVLETIIKNAASHKS